MATRSRIPTGQLGADQYVGGFSAPILDDFEVTADTQWPTSVCETYPAMLNDPHVEGMYRGVMLPIRAYDWWLDPNGSRPEVSTRISTAYNLPVGEDSRVNQARSARRFIFDEHLEDVLRGPGLGHAYFEQVWDVDVDAQDRLLAVLRKLAYRPARSIQRIQPARDGGLDFIEVPAANPAGGGTRGTVEIPVGRLVAYVWDREASNWAGRSMLRSLYQPWKLKARVIRAGVYAIERAGGIPTAIAPENADQEHTDKLLDALKALRSGPDSALVASHGTQLQFANAGGGTQAVEYVRLQNEEMARGWVQMLMMLGTTSSAGLNGGSMAETFAGRAQLVEQAIANWAAKIFTRHVIEDDVDLNEGPDEPLTPVLRFTPKGSAVDALASAMDNAQTSGALPADSTAATVVKAAAGERKRAHRSAQPRATATPATDSPSAKAQTDFEDLQRQFEIALAATVAAWNVHRKALIDDLVAQVEAATTPAELAAVAAGVADTTWLTDTLYGVLAHGAESVRTEAALQGHVLADANLDVVTADLAAAAEGKAALLARALSQSAASRAIAVGTGTLHASEVAAQVRDHLNGLTGADAEYELRGLVTKAQNAGRVAQMGEAPDGTRYYASELNDSNICEFCADEDETEFGSLGEALTDYPGGGFLGCAGGERCRGTIVAVMPDEAAPSA